MNSYRQLEITGNGQSLDNVLQHITDSLAKGWERGLEQENILKNPSTYCFICPQTSKHRACFLLLHRADDNRLWVSNIISTDLEREALSFDEANDVLEEFYEYCVSPALSHALILEDVRVKFSPAVKKLKDIMSPETAKLLETFSVAANKSNAASHPLDERRWYAFLIAAHKENIPDAFDLQQWLEENDWSNEVASRLFIKYESARSLLAYYDKTC